MRLAKTMLLVIALAQCVTGIVVADCHVGSGRHVVLFGTSDDPNVFVWDSRFRLRDYQGGTFDQARAMLPHAFLAPPGTRAIIFTCVSNFVHAKYSDLPDDAVGITIVSGPLRGRRGWILGTALR